MKIALLGGTFDPPHNGHVAICHYVLNHQLAKSLWVIPAFQHPFQKSCESFDHRLAMCRLAFDSFGKQVLVMDIERQMGSVSYTIRTIEELTRQYPDERFLLIIGSDVADNLDKWKDGERLKQLVEIIIIPRGADSIIPAVSSTDVRKKIGAGREISQDVPKKVARYILENHLYE